MQNFLNNCCVITCDIKCFKNDGHFVLSMQQYGKRATCTSVAMVTQSNVTSSALWLNSNLNCCLKTLFLDCKKWCRVTTCREKLLAVLNILLFNMYSKYY